jgi:hypothetical protein
MGTGRGISTVYVRLIGVWPGFVCLDARTSTFPNFVPPSNNILDYNIASKLSGFTSVRDEQTKTQYAYNSVGFLLRRRTSHMRQD